MKEKLKSIWLKIIGKKEPETKGPEKSEEIFQSLELGMRHLITSKELLKARGITIMVYYRGQYLKNAKVAFIKALRKMADDAREVEEFDEAKFYEEKIKIVKSKL